MQNEEHLCPEIRHMILLLIMWALAGAFVVALLGAILTVTVLPQPSAATSPPSPSTSDFTRFCTHLLYWFAAFFLLKVTIPSVPEFISWVVVCWIALGCTTLTFLFIKPRAPRTPAASS